ncbi:MAG: hypothetical protein KF753_04950 [Caldilineaceae bacterium]|nr:hypothetical protein [Caldilineaceae bacterium]
MYRKSLLFVALLLAILAVAYAGPTRHTLAAVSPLPPGGETIPVPPPTVVAEPLPGEAGNPIESIDHPAQLEQITEALGMPLQAIKHLPPEAYNGLIKANAAKLGVNVYERGEDGKMHLTAKGRELEPVSAVPQSRAGTGTKIYLPMVSVESLTVANIQQAIDRAKSHVDRLYAAGSTYGYIKEYMGFPLWLENPSRPGDSTYPRMAGHYQNDDFSIIQWFHVYETSEQMYITFEEGYDWNYGEPGLYAYRAYGTDGTITYQVQVHTFTSSNQVKLWLGNYLIDNDLRSIPSGWYQLTTTVNGTAYPAPLAAHRYTFKHATQLGEHIYDIWNDSSREAKLDASLNAYGFGPDIYNPLFKLDTGYHNDYMFTTTPYHDCDFTLDGVNSTLPWGNVSGIRYYPYEPKECTLGIYTYLQLAKQDYLSPLLQAVHVLNRYNNPDHSYCRPSGSSCVWTSPRGEARRIESQAWNGYGIKAFGKPAEYASAVRSNAFLVLETLLGHKYGDATSREYAAKMAQEMLNTLWGANWTWEDYRGSTGDDGQVVRPQHYGGQMVSWVPESALVAGRSKYVYALPARTWLSELVDYFNMPSEVEGVLPANAESSATFIQAMRTYLYWRWGVQYPNGQRLP